MKYVMIILLTSSFAKACSFTNNSSVESDLPYINAAIKASDKQAPLFNQDSSLPRVKFIKKAGRTS